MRGWRACSSAQVGPAELGASLHAAPHFPRSLFLISWISPPGVSLQ